MTKKEMVVKWIERKMRNESFFTYEEIADAVGFHPKYVLKLKKEIEDGTVSLVHGNKNRHSLNSVPDEEKEYIIDLFKRSHVSIKKFQKFYGKRSYSCIYHILTEAGLVQRKSRD